MQYTNGNPAKAERNLTIANDRIKGMTVTAIANKHDLSKAHISDILNSKDIKPIIERTYLKLANIATTKLPDNYDQLVNSDNERIKLEASRDLAKMIGIAGNDTPPVLQQFIQINQANMIDQRVQQVIQAHNLDLLDDNDILEVDST